MTMKRKYIDRSETRDRILTTLKEYPGLTTREILNHLGNIKLVEATNIIHGMYKGGYITQSGIKTHFGTNGIPYKTKMYAVSDTPNVPKAEKVADKDTTHSDVLATLKARVLELESWKFDAITRYPDLAADPIVLKARRLVSEEVRAGGDFVLADRIFAGNKDDGLLMRVTVRALEEAHG